MNMEWYWWLLIGFIVWQVLMGLIFGFGSDEDGFKIGSDPGGGTFGKSFNWHKRERIHTITFDPYPYQEDKGEWKPNGDGTFSKPAPRTKK